MEERDALVILLHTQRLGPVKARFLIRHFTSAKQALYADPREVACLPGFDEALAKDLSHWREKDGWKKDLEEAHRHNVEIISYADACYPRSLLSISDYPMILYVMGKILPEDEHSIALVGTRCASIYGMEMACQLGEDLARASLTVVSGLARGIDTGGHKGALKSGRTIAFLGSGLAKPYPPENEGLARLIAEKGAIVSELPMNTRPGRQYFPRRNRLVSGMSMGTVLVEAPIKSGAMITMNRAKEQGRKLFALPGRADNKNFRGNHSLIKKGEAQLVENAKDILESFDNFFFQDRVFSQEKKQGELSSQEEDLLEKMPDEELTIEEFVHLARLPVDRVNVLLMGLVLKKRVKEFPGKIYKRI